MDRQGDVPPVRGHEGDREHEAAQDQQGRQAKDDRRPGPVENIELYNFSA